VLLTHGGLGAIREAIAHLVPMAVFPFIADQPANAQRIAHHRLGLAGSLAETTADELQSIIARLDGDPAFRANLERMRERFRAAERAEPGIQIIEREVAAATCRPAVHAIPDRP
jgi:UDP:flavonoid glycosyltransferase YjiC (YdhE family)